MLSGFGLVLEIVRYRGVVTLGTSFPGQEDEAEYTGLTASGTRRQRAMAKTHKGKKVVPVRGHMRKHGRKRTKVRRHKRSTPN